MSGTYALFTESDRKGRTPSLQIAEYERLVAAGAGLRG
jgi:hypothetical protein